MFQPREDFSDSLGGGESLPRFLSNIWGQVTCKMSVESSHFPDKLGRVNNSSVRKRFNLDKVVHNQAFIRKKVGISGQNWGGISQQRVGCRTAMRRSRQSVGCS